MDKYAKAFVKASLIYLGIGALMGVEMVIWPDLRFAHSRVHVHLLFGMGPNRRHLHLYNQSVEEYDSATRKKLEERPGKWDLRSVPLRGTQG